MTQEQKLFIPGPAGRLEAIVTLPEAPWRGLAVVAHPHPLHHGSMHNKIVYILGKAFQAQHYLTVKFNFRGVGKSEGQYGAGQGEVEDVIAVTQAMHDCYAAELGDTPLLLAGFSFGGGIQVHAAQHLNPQTLVLVAPSVERLHAPPVAGHAKQVVIIQGDHDQIVPLQTVLNWAAPQKLPVTVVPGAEHFFHGKLGLLKDIVQRAC